MAYTYEDIPIVLQEKLDTWRSERDLWLDYSRKCEELYLNDVEGTKTNYTLQQVQNIENKAQIPTSINYIYPTTDHKKAILAQARTSNKIVSLDGRGRKVAELLDKMKSEVLRSSEALLENEQTIRNMLVTGIGAQMVYPKDFYTEGEFSITVGCIPNDELILDCNSKKMSLADIEGFFIEKEITLDKAEKIYGKLIEEVDLTMRQEMIDKEGNDKNHIPITLETLSRGGFSNGIPVTAEVKGYGRYNSKLRVLEFYDKYYTTVYNVQDINTGDYIKVFEENLTERDVELSIQIEKTESKWDAIFWRKWLILGNKLVAVEMLPITKCPLEVTFFEWGGRPYKSYGMVHYVKGMQEAYDKAIQNMILNGILTNNAGYKAPKGAIAPNDRSKWEKQGNNPNVIKEYIPQIYAGNAYVPEKEMIQGLSNFYPTLLEILKSGIEYSTGINPMVQGNPTDSKIEVFSTLQQYQSAAMQRVTLALQHVNQSQENLGNVLIQYLSANIRIGEHYAFFNEQSENEDGLDEISIAKEIAQDIQLGKWKVVSIPSTLLPTQRMAVSQELMKIAQSSPDPMERKVYTNKGLELADIKETRNIQKQLDAVNQLSSQIKQMEEENQRLIELNKQLENQTIQSKIEVKVLQGAHSSIDAITTAEAETKKDLEIERLKKQLKEKKSLAE